LIELGFANLDRTTGKDEEEKANINANIDPIHGMNAIDVEFSKENHRERRGKYELVLNQTNIG